MLFARHKDAKCEFSLDLDGGRPRVMCTGDGGWYARVWLSRAEAIAAAKILIDAAAGMPERERQVGTHYCSFCGKSQYEVHKLIAGPTVFICDECTALCTDIVAEEKAAGEKGAGKADG